MIRNFKLVKIDSKYCNYLRKYDNKVSYNAGSKDLRPFIGILFMIDEFEYFAPLSSPKEKHLKMKNNLDFIKIDKGRLGVINFNNMIPVTYSNYQLLDLNDIPDNLVELKRQNMLKSQLKWLNANSKNIKKNSFKLYLNYNNGRLDDRIKTRCCNFKLLEKKCLEYNNEK